MKTLQQFLLTYRHSGLFPENRKGSNVRRQRYFGGMLAFIGITMFSLNVSAQTANSSTTFNRPTLNQLIQTPATPQPFSFQRIDISGFGKPANQPQQYFPLPQGNPSPSASNNRQQLQQYERDLQQANVREQQLDEIRNDLANESMYIKYMEWMSKTKSFREAFNTLNSFNPEDFSISKAIFTVENAWYDNKYTYQSLAKALKIRADAVRQLLKKESLSTKNNTALNYGIMKMFRQPNTYYNSQTKQTVTMKPFRYDFDDIMGEKDYTKMFTIKLLLSGKGQCHSLPLLYLMIAEQLGAKAYLSLAPEHSFIQFPDNNGNLLNFETTNGNLVSSNWLQQSGFINASALRSKTYLDTLSQRNLYAQCLTDLLLGYMNKFGYDEFAEQIRQRILQVNPNNIAASIIDANIKTQIALQAINAAGRPKPEDLPKYPQANQAYIAMQAAYDKVDGLGYQDMPKEAYQKWLKSIEAEKKKQQTKEVEEQMKREMEYLRKHQGTIIIKPRD